MQSPQHMCVFVTGAVQPSGHIPNDVGLVVERLRSGAAGSTELVGDGAGAIALALRAERSLFPGALAEVRGYARAESLPSSLDPTDLQPARALRRALAVARMAAADVGYACASFAGAPDPTRAMAALRRGLGRFASNVVLEVDYQPALRCVIAIALSDPGRAQPFEGDPNLRRVVEDVRGSLRGRRVGGALALIVRPAGDAVALAFGQA